MAGTMLISSSTISRGRAFASFQTFAIAVSGEYVGKIYFETMRRKSNMTEVQPWASDPQAMCRRARRSY